MSTRIRQTEGNAGFSDVSLKYDTVSFIRHMFVAFTQGLFINAPNGYKWSQDLESSDIVITDESPINISVIGKRPALGFSRGPMQANNFAMGDMNTLDMNTGAKSKSILISGSMSINSCSRVDLESERLAWFTAEQMGIHRELLMKNGFFDIGRNWAISAPTPAGTIVSGDTGDEWYCTIVSMPFQIHRNSLQIPLGRQILGGLSATLNASFAKSANAVGPADANGGNPPYQVRASVDGSFLQPHPLNPTQKVTVREVNPYRGGHSTVTRAIPVSSVTVEESEERKPMVQWVKI